MSEPNSIAIRKRGLKQRLFVRSLALAAGVAIIIWLLDVFDRVVAGQKRIDDDGRGDRHQRGNQVERADPAFNQPARPSARADDRHDTCVGAHDERGKQKKRSK